jgi:Txe/YoeB family toxin of Txe-Axe toxin-antitoxin module
MMNVQVHFDRKALKEYEALKTIDRKLYENAEDKINQLKKGLESVGRPTIGEIIPKSELSSKRQKFLREIDCRALWKIDLRDGWRMVYTVNNDGVQIIAFVLHLGDHKSYERFLNN